MSDTLYESEILKSLEALDDILSKSQIETGGGNEPKSWAGSKPEEEDEPDNTEANGTDHKKSGMSKGQDDESTDVVKSGVEVSTFLNELTKSIAVYCADLEDHVVKALGQIHEENGAMSKAIAENLVVLEEVVAKSQGNISEYADEPARAPKSMLDMSKSVSGSDDPELSKSVVLGALMKGVEAGTVSPLEVIKVEQFGIHAVNQDVVKSLLA